MVLKTLLILVMGVWLGGEQGQPLQRGEFRVLVDGKPAGTEQFTVAGKGSGFVVTSTGETVEGGRTVKLVTSTEIEKTRMVRYSVDLTEGAETRRYSMEFADGKVRVVIEAGGMKTERLRQTSQRPVVLDKNVWHHYQFLLGNYDPLRKGRQRFRVFIPQSAFREYNADVELKSVSTAEIGGVKRKVLKFSIIIADGFEVIVRTDERAIPFSIEIPSQDLKAIAQ